MEIKRCLFYLISSPVTGHINSGNQADMTPLMVFILAIVSPRTSILSFKISVTHVMTTYVSEIRVSNQNLLLTKVIHVPAVITVIPLLSIILTDDPLPVPSVTSKNPKYSAPKGCTNAMRRMYPTMPNRAGMTRHHMRL